MTDKVKRWPREYYATKFECTIKALRRSSPKKAQRQGVFGWRSWQHAK